MPILAIDTSTMVSGAAIAAEDRLIAEVLMQLKLPQSQVLLGHIKEVLHIAHMDKKDLTGIAVSIGPGSFTGLRIGLATAKGLAFSWDVPIIGVETPVSLAWNFAGNQDLICPLIDAQKGNVYAAAYSWQGWELRTEKDIEVLPLDAVLEAAKDSGRSVLFCGDGALMAKDAIAAARGALRMAPPTMAIPRAGSLALAAQKRLDAGHVDDCLTLTPAYKRRSEAEVLWEKRHGGKAPL